MAEPTSTLTARGKATRVSGEFSSLSSPDRIAGTAKLSEQYGGNSNSGWVGCLPKSWLPYVQLARLSPPVGICLIYFPHLFGVLHAAILQKTSPLHLLTSSLSLLGGSIFVSNAIHIWNDLIDAPLDALVERTRNRPIPRGAVSPSGALVFTATQTVGALAFLYYLVPPLNGGSEILSTVATLNYALPGIIAWTYYPYAKRHTNFPQLVLGFSLSWGIVMGSLAVGKVPYYSSLGVPPVTGPFWPDHLDRSSLALFSASTLWSVIYDTIYAHQDLEDDIKAGIKSLAVYFKGQTKPALSVLLFGMTSSLVASGWYGGLGPAYYIIAAGGATTSLGLMIANVDLKDSASCWWWFSKGFWLAGGAITAGLLAEYVVQLWN